MIDTTWGGISVTIKITRRNNYNNLFKLIESWLLFIKCWSSDERSDWLCGRFARGSDFVSFHVIKDIMKMAASLHSLVEILEKVWDNSNVGHFLFLNNKRCWLIDDVTRLNLSYYHYWSKRQVVQRAEFPSLWKRIENYLPVLNQPDASSTYEWVNWVLELESTWHGANRPTTRRFGLTQPVDSRVCIELVVTLEKKNAHPFYFWNNKTGQPVAV